MPSHYVVQEILDRRIGKKGKYQYLIHWENYTKEESTWEPLNNLTYVKNMVEDFDQRYEEQSPKETTRPSQPIKRNKMKSPPKIVKKEKILLKKQAKEKKLGGNMSRCKIEQPRYKHTESKDEKLKILGLCVDNDGQYIYLVQDNIGMKSYKTRSYLLKEYPETLVCYYENHIKIASRKSP